MSNRSIPVGKADIVVRVDEDLKVALQKQATAEHRSVANLLGHIARGYLDRVGCQEGTPR